MLGCLFYLKGRFRPSYFHSARMYQAHSFLLSCLRKSYERKGVIHYLKKVVIHRRSGRTHGARLVEEIRNSLSRTAATRARFNTTATAAMMKARLPWAPPEKTRSRRLPRCRPNHRTNRHRCELPLRRNHFCRVAAAIRTKRARKSDSCQWRLLLPPYFVGAKFTVNEYIHLA